jgi:uncharacterized membrane protein YbjE (DUF340 family)
VEAMIETLAMLLIGLAIGFMFKKLGMQSIKAKLDDLLSIIVLFLLFLMGIAFGSVQKIINNFMTLGYNSVVLSALAFLGSIIFGYLFRR